MSTKDWEYTKFGNGYEEPTMDLRFKRRDKNTMGYVLQQKWILTSTNNGEHKRTEEWRDVPTVQ